MNTAVNNKYIITFKVVHLLFSFINTNYFILIYIFYFQPLSFSDNLKYIAISNTYEVYFMYVIYKLYIE